MEHRSTLHEGGQSSPLYTAPRRNINPSTSGGHIQDEINEVTRWINHHLAIAGHTDQLITDLSTDMADGITLLRLTQELSKEELPRHFSNPIMRVQKLENLQMCIRVLQEKGVPLKGIHANDIASGNLKSVLALCHALKKMFTSNEPKSTSSVSVSHYQQSAGGSGVSAVPSHSTRLSFSSLDREDMALLGWLGDVVHRDLTNYSMLYDGKVLCDFANEIKEDSVSEEDIISGSKKERLQIAFTAIQNLLFVKPTDIEVSRVGTGLEDLKLRRYLINCREVFKQREQRQQRGWRHGSKKSTSRNSTPSMEEMFESLRTSKGSSASTLEQREAAKVEARSLAGLRQKKLSETSSPPAPHVPPSMGKKLVSEKKGKSEEPSKTEKSTSKSDKNALTQQVGDSGPSHSSSPRLSTSTDNLAPSKQSTKHSLSMRTKGTLHSSHGRLVSTRHNTRHAPSRPFSDIYVSGDPSLPSLQSVLSQPDLQFNNPPNELLSSPENWELHGRGLSQDSALSQPLLQPQPPIVPSQTTSHSLSRSLDARLGPAIPSLGHTHTRSQAPAYGSHQTSLAKQLAQTPSGYKGSFSLPRTKRNQSPPSSPSSTSPTSSTPHPLPTVPPPSISVSKSLGKSTESANQPTFLPPSGKFPRKSPTYHPPHDENLSQQIADLQDRIALLSTELLHEKADVYTRLHRAVIRERKKRQAIEKHLQDMERTTKQLVKRYDGCLVHLAKEIVSVKEQLESGGQGTSSGAKHSSGIRNKSYLTKEVDLLRKQVSSLAKRMDKNAENVAQSSSAPGRPKERLFMRKRANSDSQGPFLKGPTTSFNKLSRFFGEDPPRLEDMETFLEGLGYSHLYPIFSTHQISLAELCQMDKSHLEVLGIPLGPRIRIIAEIRKLEPFDKRGTVV